MPLIQTEDKDLLDANVRKIISQSAIRKLGQLADESKRDDISKAIFAKRMLCVFTVFFAVAAAVYVIAPQSIIGILRTATASFH
jgi:hypothetical protein